MDTLDFTYHSSSILASYYIFYNPRAGCIEIGIVKYFSFKGKGAFGVRGIAHKTFFSPLET